MHQLLPKVRRSRVPGNNILHGRIGGLLTGQQVHTHTHTHAHTHIYTVNTHAHTHTYAHTELCLISAVDLLPSRAVIKFASFAFVQMCYGSFRVSPASGYNASMAVRPAQPQRRFSQRCVPGQRHPASVVALARPSTPVATSPSSAVLHARGHACKH